MDFSSFGFDSSVLKELGGKALQMPPMAPMPPTTNVNGDLNFRTDGWTVATGQGRATSTLLPDWQMLAVVALAGLLIWKKSKKS